MFPFADNVPRVGVPLVTYLIIALNFAAFIYTLRLSPDARELLAYRRGFIPVRMSHLADDHRLRIDLPKKIVVRNPRTLQSQLVDAVDFAPDTLGVIVTLFTAMFMHGGWMHLIGNMWMLWIFGDNVEDRLGHAKYAIFYLAGGLLATLSHWAVERSSGVPLIGASGAIAAVLGAYAITWPAARVKTFVMLVFIITIIEVPAIVFLGVWFVTQLVNARADTLMGATAGVAWWAHIGGFVAGAIAMPWLRDDDNLAYLPDGEWHGP